MTLIEKLQNHKGCLIRIKTQLWWYGIGWDNMPGRVYLVLDSSPLSSLETVAASKGKWESPDEEAAALLLVNGSPQWVWVTECDLEIINDLA